MNGLLRKSPTPSAKPSQQHQVLMFKKTQGSKSNLSSTDSGEPPAMAQSEVRRSKSKHGFKHHLASLKEVTQDVFSKIAESPNGDTDLVGLISTTPWTPVKPPKPPMPPSAVRPPAPPTKGTLHVDTSSKPKHRFRISARSFLSGPPAGYSSQVEPPSTPSHGHKNFDALNPRSPSLSNSESTTYVSDSAKPPSTTDGFQPSEKAMSVASFKTMRPLSPLDSNPAIPKQLPIARADQICADLLDQLFPHRRSPIWKDTVIFALKGIFESQTVFVSSYGIYHTQALSTNLLLRILKELLSNGESFFEHHSDQTHFDLELHLRCVTAGLRLLCSHTIEAGAGSLSTTSFESLYEPLVWWNSFQQNQVTFDKKKGKEKKALNYNNEFLLVYIRDLLASIPVEQNMVANVTKRLMYAATAAGHLYSKNLVQAATSLKIATQRISPPSDWHAKYRTMDDLCQSVLFWQRSVSASDTEENKVVTDNEHAVVGHLLAVLDTELNDESAFNGDMIGTALKVANDATQSAPFARKGHFVYGVLDLLQLYVCAMLSGKFDNQVIETLIKVLEISEYSFLRCKAFEVLASFNTKHGVGQIVPYSVKEILERDDVWPPNKREKISLQWKAMSTKVWVDDPYHLARLKQKLPDCTKIVQFDEQEGRSLECILTERELEYHEKEEGLQKEIDRLIAEKESDRVEREVEQKRREEDLQKEMDRLRAESDADKKRLKENEEEWTVMSNRNMRLKQDLDALKEQHQQEVSELRHRNEELQSVCDLVRGALSPPGQRRDSKDGMGLPTSMQL